MIVFMMSKMFELNQAELNGDKLMQQSLKLVEKKSVSVAEKKKIENGQLLSNYIKLMDKKKTDEKENKVKREESKLEDFLGGSRMNSSTVVNRPS
eukprot:CAMPEP_0170554062 /NCGR_PEP_ID=MMETSP0211-20121228/11931_1 /TAXON_ID=311385 /ORGANISM="Pseudokeronopsis sp., Strain OXSARD2" /LENGTH=94 /DNA_ID=CAMNT_0010862871 /DNA_START=826 /DNA_END=1110 /DNA_ORIENTATION=+